MSENKASQEEHLQNEVENKEINTEETTENLSQERSTEEILAEEKDRYIRLYAEFENYKKRTAKERMEFFQYANQEMMISMLGILDYFERALNEMT